ncbi:hypothetical protein Syn6312_1249 [Synechococcus sp. PCC 6312]|nr:hypothetical protein Syn6312_1249 [Synechococcus sp. PCC 6312]
MFRYPRSNSPIATKTENLLNTDLTEYLPNIDDPAQEFCHP